MSERPILFSAEMVRAILAGRKTQTRRLMKVQPYADSIVTVKHYHPTVIDRHGDMQPGPEIFGALWGNGEYGLRCPYGAPGDLLWVRETWGAVSPTDEPVPLALGQCEIEYRADLPPGCTDGPGEWPGDERNHPGVPKWRPSIHMPRWASRITLRITDVRVERVQDISRQDCEAEGCAGGHGSIPGYNYSATPREHFFHLWNRINGPGAWGDNPWVWVLSFERVKP